MLSPLYCWGALLYSKRPYMPVLQPPPINPTHSTPLCTWNPSMSRLRSMGRTTPFDTGNWGSNNRRRTCRKLSRPSWLLNPARDPHSAVGQDCKNRSQGPANYSTHLRIHHRSFLIRLDKVLSYSGLARSRQRIQVRVPPR